MGNLARLMSITPNEIRSSTPRFQELDEFIKNNLFNSIIEVYKPDVFISNQDEEEDVNDEINISEMLMIYNFFQSNNELNAFNIPITIRIINYILLFFLTILIFLIIKLRYIKNYS